MTQKVSSAHITSAEEVSGALADGQFVLRFQPIIELDCGRVRGVEALIRWDHPQGGLLVPDDFIPALSQTPDVAAVTRWVLRTACAAVARWPQWTMGVNITARDVARGGFVRDVLDALEAADVSPHRLVLELTETALVQDLPRAAESLGELRKRGVNVALDDFGTGYSSILYLRELPITSIKIDRMFVAGVTDDGDDRAIVISLLTLARNIGLTAVAEGVETQAQADALHLLGCPLAQGYLWAAPLTEDDAGSVHEAGLATLSPRRRPVREARTPLPDERIVRRVLDMVADGASLHTIAAALNASGERTQRGSRWHAASVAHVINRGSGQIPS